MGPLADPVGLRALHLGLRVIDLVELQEQLIGVFIRRPAVLGAPVCQHPQNRYVVVLEEGQHPIIEQVGRGNGHLGRVHLGKAHGGVGVHCGLLINPAHALEVAHIERVLAEKIAGMGSLDLVGIGLPLAFGGLQGHELGLGVDDALLGRFLLQ